MLSLLQGDFRKPSKIKGNQNKNAGHQKEKTNGEAMESSSVHLQKTSHRNIYFLKQYCYQLMINAEL